MPDLYQELCKLADSDMYPFHMPGHKRNLESTPMKGAFRCDITEIDDFDNLHNEEGILLECEQRANKLYGADTTYYLVNGSTCGVLAALSAVVSEGDVVLAARGSHKSFYNAAYIRNVSIEYLPYMIDRKYGVPNSYSAQFIEKYLTEKIKAVFVTSPTYEGKCSDIRAIADACHKRGIPFIVDAAHGAHFCLENMPESAVEQGADIVIHSLHKTLPSMTQTALLHIRGELVDKERVKRFLRIYQTSSPSYVLMSSMDLCIKEMCDKGKDFAEKMLQYRRRIQEETACCQNLCVPTLDEFQDPAKIMIVIKIASMTGPMLYDILREEYHLQLEMAGEKYVLAIISGWDTEAGIRRLIDAINKIDKEIVERIADNNRNTMGKGTNTDQPKDRLNGTENTTVYVLPEVEMTIKEAWDAGKEEVPIAKAVGRISAEFVNLYPPGIPVITPGEIIDEVTVTQVENYLKENMNVLGLSDRKGFICVRQK